MNKTLPKVFSVITILALMLAALPMRSAQADSSAQALPFSQDWTNTGLITVDDIWTGVPGIIGYRGDGLTAATGVNPQTVVADGTATPVDVTANQTTPNTFTTGGVAEFHITNPVVAFQGSGTARAPFLLLHLNTTGESNINVAYNLRDIDGSADNAIQPVALQYRVGSSGNFTNLPAGFVADASTGPSLATLVTPVSVTLPAAADNQPLVQVRVITTDAVGSDELIGIDDISITGEDGPTDPSGVGAASPSTVVQGGSTLLTVAVTSGANPTSTGLAVICDLSTIGGLNNQTFLDNGTNGDVTAGDNVFSFGATVDIGTVPEAKNLPCTITDAESRTASASIALTVIADPAPAVSSTTPTNGATNVAVNTNITVNFSEVVDVAAGAIIVECPSGTPVASNAAAVDVTSVVIDPASDLPVSTTCVANVDEAGVTDNDTNDPPDDMDADFNWSFTTLTPIVSSVIINELDADNPSTDTLEFVELYDGGAGNTSLSGLVVVFYNGNGDTSYAAFDLDGFSTNASGYFVLGNSGVTPAPGIVFSNDTLQNGQDAVALYGANASDFPNGTGVSTANIIDAIVYDTDDADDPGLLVLLNAGQPQVNENGGGNGTAHSSQRCPNGSGGARNTNTYAQFNPTAGTFNFCVNDAAPSVTSTNPTGGASNVSNSSNIDITFSENVNVSGSWFNISCTLSGLHTAVASGGPTTFTLNPDADFVNSETCTVTIVAAQVADQDANDPPDNMLTDHIFSFSTEGPICDQDFTPIYDIQGSGLSAAITGAVTTEGVVVGDFEGTAAASGFYIQDLDGDGNAATSDGIFVFTGNTNLASAGDVVRVTGFARERFNQTTLNGSNSNTAPVTNVVNCGTGSVLATDVTLPFADANFPERYEGMYVNFPQPLVISEYFNYARFGEMVLALPLNDESRPFSGTAIDEPGVGLSPANLRTAANALSRITLDDVQSAQNPGTLRHPNGLAFSLSNLFRGGDTVQNAVGVLGFDFNLYRIVPTGPADYTPVNPRPAAPEPVGGTLRVAAMNTLNFFVTLDTTVSDTGPGPCGALQNLDCRGADSIEPDEFTRQRDKLLTALLGLDADIIGLNELESTPGAEPLISITSGMPGYAYIDTGPIGTDAIKVGIIYRPSVVVPIGDYQILDSTDDPRFIDTRSRPALAQTFEELATGARFTVVVNHLKSKGSACAGDPDILDGQGNCNGTRTLAAQALVDWLATDPTESDDPDFLIMGDLNAYAQEDPIDAIKLGSDDAAGTDDDFTNLIFDYHGAFAYSYTFDGQAGYLDHALANASLADQITGAADWHINSDEPSVLDYDTSFKPPAQEALYAVDPYRTSDHDSVVVGLGLDPDLTCNGLPATIVGTTGDDEINGTNGPDVIVGLGGNDVINGNNGNDIICAGAGNDTVNGGTGNDLVFGGYGNDILNGQNGFDTLNGDAGNDTLDGGNDPDTLNGGNGSDNLIGGGSNDVLDGGADNDSLAGNNGIDSLTGGAGADSFSGGAGADTNVDFNAGDGDTTDGT